VNETRAARYQRLKRRTHAAGVISGGVMLVLLVVTPAGRWLADWARSTSAGASAPVAALVSLAAFVLCAVVLWELIALPSAAYWAVRAGRRYLRSGGEPTVEGVLGAQAQASLVALVGAGVAGLAVELGVWATGAAWWLTAGLLVAAALAGAVAAAPWVLGQLGGARPVSQPELASHLAELASRARVAVAGIDEWQGGGPSSTAIVAGVGRARRIFVAHELVQDWTTSEIGVVVAHELAHHAHGDLWRTWLVDAAVLSSAFAVAEAARGWLGPSLGLADRSDLAALPFVALVGGLVWLAATPIRHALSRRQERAADEFALQLTGEDAAFGAALRRLSARHLVEEDPAPAVRWLYHRHPTVAERLAAAERFARTRGRVRNA
jgi:STE24 endopeptidase